MTVGPMVFQWVFYLVKMTFSSINYRRALGYSAIFGIIATMRLMLFIWTPWGSGEVMHPNSSENKD